MPRAFAEQLSRMGVLALGPNPLGDELFVTKSPFVWAVVLRSEIASCRRSSRSSSQECRAEFKADIAGVRQGIGGLRTDLHKEISGLRADMARELPPLFLGVLGLKISRAGLVVAASRFL